MEWCCFLFWFVYRFCLACLAHFNWSMAIYTNCVYFTLWKSYDILWFWMHLILCTCFKALRRENYLIIWCNLIFKKHTQYPHHTYKQLYLIFYGSGLGKAERELQRMDTVEVRERQRRESKRKLIKEDSSSSDDDVIDENRLDGNTVPGTSCDTKLIPTSSDVYAEEDVECMKYAYVGQAVDSQADFNAVPKDEEEPEFVTDTTPLAPQRRPRNLARSPPTNDTPDRPIPSVSFNLDETRTKNGDSTSNNQNSQDQEEKQSPLSIAKQNISKVPGTLFNNIKNLPLRFRQNRSEGQLSTTLDSGTSNDDTISVSSTWARIKEIMPNPLKFVRSVSENPADPNEIDVLAPNFTNTYDVKNERQLKHRQRRDKKALTKKVRARIREELKEIARIEKRRRMVSDSIELFLQLLRMMSSFAILVGNIRKTFIPAQFKYLKPGQHPYDNYELMLMYRLTTFLDVAMFWTNVLWVYCLQWHLLCRLGCLRFWSWAALLLVISLTVMIIPMGYCMDQMDLSWCRFGINSTLEKYQPKWFVFSFLLIMVICRTHVKGLTSHVKDDVLISRK